MCIRDRRLPVDADSPVGAHPLLGRIAFGENDQPGNLIEVSLTALTSRVMGASRHGITISDRPVFIQLPLLGRGLGRVIAHEIGHWAIGRGHTQDGLMKPSFGVVDLVERTAPAVPAGLMEARVCADRLASPTRGLTERR